MALFPSVPFLIGWEKLALANPGKEPSPVPGGKQLQDMVTKYGGPGRFKNDLGRS